MRDLTGLVFGRLTAISLNSKGARGWMWNCLCSCGASHVVGASHLLGGKSKSCGCLRVDMASVKTKTHGKTRTKTNIVWQGMRARCNNPTNRAYPRYGGRGIKVCSRWDDYSLFLEDMGEAPEGKFLDRKDNDGNYEPGNCRWATRTQQNRNTSQNVLIAYLGKTRCLSEWCEILGLGYNKVYMRIYKLNWSIERAFEYGNPN